MRSVWYKFLRGEDRHKIADWCEGRRLRAWELKQQGWKQSAIARALGVTRGAVSQWMKQAREEGVSGLYRRIAPGPAWKLSAEQRSHLPVLRGWMLHYLDAMPGSVSARARLPSRASRISRAVCLGPWPRAKLVTSALLITSLASGPRLRNTQP